MYSLRCKPSYVFSWAFFSPELYDDTRRRGKMTELSWGYPGHNEFKRNASKKHASSWLPGHPEGKWHWKQHMRCYCTKARGTWDDSLLDLQFNPVQLLLWASKPPQCWRRAISVQRVVAKQLDLERSWDSQTLLRTNPPSARAEGKRFLIHWATQLVSRNEKSGIGELRQDGLGHQWCSADLYCLMSKELC